MHGIYVNLIFLFSILTSTNSFILRKDSSSSTEMDLFHSELSKRRDISNKDHYPTTVEKLLYFLRKHQQDEEELKSQIKSLLLNLQTASIRDTQSQENKCISKTDSIRSILSRLDLSSKQTELLQKIVLMMQDRPYDNINSKRQNIESNDDTIGYRFNIYGSPIEKKSSLDLKESIDDESSGNKLKLNTHEIKDIAKEVLNIINSHKDYQTTTDNVSNVALSDMDNPISESSTELNIVENK